VSVTVREGSTQPKKRHTEDTLLSAMENAGAEDMPDDAERRGLGTPATRAAILERLVKAGFVERSKKNLLPTDKGKTLIAVLPEPLTSANLTAEWENKLLQVQRGELDADAFMDGIAEFVKSIVLTCGAPKPEYLNLFPQTKKQTAEPLGLCPRCGSPVREGAKGYFCDSRTCGFKLWKDSKFWTAKRKPLTAEIAAALLGDGRVALKGLYSDKTGKTYDAAVILDDPKDESGAFGKFVSFKMDFDKTRGRKDGPPYFGNPRSHNSEASENDKQQ
jgi:DNA topoisomerase-3